MCFLRLFEQNLISVNNGRLWQDFYNSVREISLNEINFWRGIWDRNISHEARAGEKSSISRDVVSHHKIPSKRYDEKYYHVSICSLLGEEGDTALRGPQIPSVYDFVFNILLNSSSAIWIKPKQLLRAPSCSFIFQLVSCQFDAPRLMSSSLLPHSIRLCNRYDVYDVAIVLTPNQVVKKSLNQGINLQISNWYFVLCEWQNNTVQHTPLYIKQLYWKERRILDILCC